MDNVNAFWFEVAPRPNWEKSHPRWQPRITHLAVSSHLLTHLLTHTLTHTYSLSSHESTIDYCPMSIVTYKTNNIRPSFSLDWHFKILFTKFIFFRQE
jgi:hypothetical protein